MKSLFSWFVGALLAVSLPLGAAVRLPALFSDHVILQRGQPVPVWGWAEAGETVAVEFAGQRQTARAGTDGRWEVRLAPLAASAEPRDLRIGERVVRDVLVGDVWLCTGQSNMGFWLRDATDGKREVAAADHPTIRLFSVAAQPALEPATDVRATWERCSPASAETFSAVGYFFGRELQRELHVPIGLLRTSLGGTPAEAWTSLPALRTREVWAGRAAAEIAEIRRQEEDNRRFVAARAQWEETHGVQPPPLAAHARGWAEPGIDPAGWKPVELPLRWKQVGAESGGVFWLRKEIVVPESARGQRLAVALGWVSEQYDTVFFNGIEIGRAPTAAPEFYLKQRVYLVPEKLVQPGRAVLAVRVVSATEQAGINQRPAAVFPGLGPSAAAGPWLLRTESTFPPLSPAALAARPKPNKASFNNVSGALYHGMVAPLVPFAVKGAIWYQGENNVPRAHEYRDLLATLIRDWRTRWGQGDFPFLIQQLVNYGPPAEAPDQFGKWPALREAQMQVATSLPACDLAVGIDVGAPEIHPPNKQEVGRRLALVARARVYGQLVEASGPRYAGMTVEGDALRVRFTHAAGLEARGGPPRNFVVAGADGKFVWADARIEGETIVVRSPQVPRPVVVRYAWADHPAGCNLYNRAGLPAAPFRTDAGE